MAAAKVVGLDWLLERAEAPVVGQVELLGVVYDLRGVDVVEDMLIVQGAVVRYLETMRPEEVTDPAQAKALIERASGKLVEVRGQVVECIRLLVPTLPMEVLDKHFPRLTDTQKLFVSLAVQAREAMADCVKKNSGGSREVTKGTGMEEPAVT